MSMEPNPIDARPLSPLDPKDAKEIAELLKQPDLKQPESRDDLVKLFNERQISVGVGDNDSELVLPYGRTISEEVLGRKRKYIKRKLKLDSPPPKSKKKTEGGRKRKRKTRKKRKKKTKKRRRKKRHRKKRTKRRK